MDSPAHLLKVAVTETNPEARMQQVVRACKLITDVLPFDRKNHALLEEPDLMKHLFLAIPLNPRVIDMIITTMIDKFKNLPYFLKEIWSAFIAIAQLEEFGNAHVVKSESAVRNFHSGVKKLLNIMSFKDLDIAPTTPSTRLAEYCHDVDHHRELIKLAVLEYVDKVLELCTKQPKQSIVFKPDIPGLVKKFILHSPSDKVAIRVCSMMEKVSFFSKDSMLNHEIEEIVLSKQSMVFDQQKYGSKASLDGNASHMKPKPNLSNLYSKTKGKLLTATEAGRFLGDNLRPSLKSIKEDKPQKEQDMQVSFNPKHHQAFEMPRDELDNEILAQSRYDNFEESADSVEARLDEWLSWEELEETPLISKSVYVYNILKNPGNLEIILAFIFDPHCYVIGECWKSKYPSIAESLDENSILNQSTTSPLLKFQKIKDDKSLQPYMMRSYKAMQVLCDVRNMKTIIQSNPKAFENYFSFLYACINTKEEHVCNYNHIAKVTEYLLKKEPEICVNYLIYYNLIYKFIQHIEFPCVQEFFQTLFNCAYNPTKISDEAFNKITKYCEIVSFFTDITQVVLSGPKSLDAKKYDCDYKPNGIENLVGGSMNASDLESLFDEKPISYRNENREAFLEDELNGLNLDIDNLYGALDSHRKIDKETLPIKKSFEKKIISKGLMNKYISLKQKYEPTESILAGIQDEELRRSGSGLDQNENSKLSSQASSLKKLPEVGDPTRSQFSRGKSNILLNSKKTPDSLLNDYTSNPKGFLLPANPSDVVGGLLYNGSEKSIRPLSNQRSIGERLKTSEGKRDNMRSTFDSRRAEGLRALKSKLSTEPSEDYGSASLPQITNPNRSHMVGSRQTLEMRRTGKEFYASPERMTLAKEFLSDVMTMEEAKQLNVLYPISHLTRIENDIDKEAKRPEYMVNNIRTTDSVAVPICSLIENLVRKALFAPPHTSVERKGSFGNEENGKKFRYELKKRLAYHDVDYAPFWDAIFHEKSKFFSHLLKNYLFKIKMHHLEEANSGYSAGKIVNLLLEKCESHRELKRFFEPIHNVCKEHVKFLSKVIIQSHAWPARKDLKIYQQNYEVKEPLGTGRILLVETLYLIIKNDYVNHYHIVQDINDTCWHTLIIWFFSKKTNNIYHRLFYSLLELTFLNCNEKFILTILVKLELLSSMHRIWGEIYQNNVFLKDNHNESMICHLKKIAVLIDSIAQKNDNYGILRSQLAGSISWNDVKQKLCPAKAEKKRDSTILSHKKHTTIKANAPILRMSPQSNARTSQNSHLKSRPDSRVEGKRGSPGKGSYSSIQLLHHK